jgi:hypothetical protein
MAFAFRRPIASKARLRSISPHEIIQRVEMKRLNIERHALGVYI